MIKNITVRSGEIIEITGYYRLSRPMKTSTLFKRGDFAPKIRNVKHACFLEQSFIMEIYTHDIIVILK